MLLICLGSPFLLYTEQMDAKGLGRELLLTPPPLATPGKTPERQTVGTVTASTKCSPLQAQCRHCKERLPGPRKGLWVTFSSLSPKTLRLLNALNSEDRGLEVRFSLATIAFDRESAQMSQILSSQGKNAPSDPYPHYLVRLAASRNGRVHLHIVDFQKSFDSLHLNSNLLNPVNVIADNS